MGLAQLAEIIPLLSLTAINVTDWEGNTTCVLAIKFLQHALGHDLFRITEFVRNSFWQRTTISTSCWAWEDSEEIKDGEVQNQHSHTRGYAV